MQRLILAALALTAIAVCLPLVPGIATTPGGDPAAGREGDYVVIAWNSLGMHCINPMFDKICILPPYNTLEAVVIKRGNPPQIVTQGLSLDFRINKNTTVDGKTNFWNYAEKLFGKPLPKGIGLEGVGLAGPMTASGDHFQALGIPVLPLNDKMQWNPYQKAVVTLKAQRGKKLITLASTEAVLPISDELNCAVCHADGADAAPPLPDNYDPAHPRRIEDNILWSHDRNSGTRLSDPANQPVLCASCHADNALGVPTGTAQKNLSWAMHEWHATKPMDTPACYDCHPGAQTHCLRSAIVGMGPVDGEPTCDHCHGDLKQMAAGLAAGRNPWVQEPTCSQCHGANYDTGSTLYRDAKGHGNLACAACHNSPHAWWPSKRAGDNTQPMDLTGQPSSIGKCSVCHTKPMDGDNPHAMYDFSSP